MLDIDLFLKNVVTDYEKLVMEAIKENFRTQSFFGTPWLPSHRSGNKKILHGQGTLENSFMASNDGNTIDITSSALYAAIHNEGGEITVTANMKKFFWAMYYKLTGAVGKKKNGTASGSKKNVALSAEAQYYKSLALMKIGSKIKIIQRQFAGYHPKMDEMAKEVVEDNLPELEQQIRDALNKFGTH